MRDQLSQIQTLYSEDWNVQTISDDTKNTSTIYRRMWANVVNLKVILLQTSLVSSIITWYVATAISGSIAMWYMVYVRWSVRVQTCTYV